MFYIPSWCLDLLDSQRNTCTLPLLPSPLLEPVTSHCQTQLASVLALLCPPPATRCSPWFHLGGSNGQLGQAVPMPGNPPREAAGCFHILLFLNVFL